MVYALVKVVGHRGAAGEEPENTIRSIMRAIECGVDFVEVDVRSTKDGVLVLLHDETLDRTTNGSGLLREHTFNEVWNLNAGKGEKIPKVEDVFNITKNRCKLLLELKEVGWERKLFNIVEKSGMLDDVIFISFHKECIEVLKELGAEVGMIFSKGPYEHVKYAKDLGLKLIAPHYGLVNKKFLSIAKKYSLNVNVWTVNDIGLMKKFIKLKVFAITSDYPCTLRRVVDLFGKSN